MLDVISVPPWLRVATENCMLGETLLNCMDKWSLLGEGLPPKYGGGLSNASSENGLLVCMFVLSWCVCLSSVGVYVCPQLVCVFVLSWCVLVMGIGFNFQN